MLMPLRAGRKRSVSPGDGHQPRNAIDQGQAAQAQLLAHVDDDGQVLGLGAAHAFAAHGNAVDRLPPQQGQQLARPAHEALAIPERRLGH
jgi:hypothetical protein